jgi:hypothetical protein
LAENRDTMAAVNQLVGKRMDDVTNADFAAAGQIERCDRNFHT